MKKTLIISFTFLFFLTFGFVNLQAQKTDNKNFSGGAVFKIPEGVLPVDWNKNGFKGMLMLDADAPAGIFISYPNEDEGIEALKIRVLKSIFPMVRPSGAEDTYGDDESKWKIKDIPTRKGDISAKYYLLEDDKQMTQILLYERETGDGLKYIYGYFAKREKDDKSSDKIWADENGKGAKKFEKFWKSFPKN